ncbi:MAG: DUF177 domain-containing protein [Sulfitobacter sp.]|nr:DUF177 domain-containing protein [Sulfitobacter sp.]
MANTAPSSTALRVAGLSQGSENGFALQPGADQLAAIAQELDLLALRKVRFTGRVVPQGGSDWRLEGTLGATAVQACVVTLAPVTTRVDVPVTRQYLAHYDQPDDPEAEMPEDETIEPLGTWIDPEAVLIEALSLALPDYPRAEEAELGEMVVTEPGQKPMTNEEAKPFAGLASLRDALEKKDD